MKRTAPIIIGFLLATALSALQPFHEVSTGYYGDLGAGLAIRLEEPEKGFPFFLQGRGAYVYQLDPGNATEARHIFINDNEGGNVEKYGESYLLALDLGWKWKEFDKVSVEFTLSGLWNYYQAHFAFIGNNEAFTVTSAPLGVGVGGAMRMKMSKTPNFLLIKGGAEYFPKTRLDAHGTYFYTPDGEDDRPRNAYTYEDADSVVNQPEFRVYLQAGILYSIGK